MNIEKLVAAAKEIDRLAVKQEERTRDLQRIASLVQKAHASGDKDEVRRLQKESTSIHIHVIDFGGAVSDLRKALKSKSIGVHE